MRCFAKVGILKCSALFNIADGAYAVFHPRSRHITRPESPPPEPADTEEVRLIALWPPGNWGRLGPPENWGRLPENSGREGV